MVDTLGEFQRAPDNARESIAAQRKRNAKGEIVINRRLFNKGLATVVAGALLTQKDSIAKAGKDLGHALNNIELPDLVKDFEKGLANGNEFRMLEGEITIDVKEGNRAVKTRSAPAVSTGDELSPGEQVQVFTSADKPVKILNPVVVSGKSPQASAPDINWAGWLHDQRWNFVALAPETAESVTKVGREIEAAVKKPSNYSRKDNMIMAETEDGQVKAVGQQHSPR